MDKQNYEMFLPFNFKLKINSFDILFITWWMHSQDEQ